MTTVLLCLDLDILRKGRSLNSGLTTHLRGEERQGARILSPARLDRSKMAAAKVRTNHRLPTPTASSPKTRARRWCPSLGDAGTQFTSECAASCARLDRNSIVQPKYMYNDITVSRHPNPNPPARQYTSTTRCDETQAIALHYNRERSSPLLGQTGAPCMTNLSTSRHA